MNLDTLHALETEVRKTVPQFKLAYKDQSMFMKVLGFFAAPFNPKFMTNYTTTVGSTVYFPSKAYYESQPKSSFTILAHEWVHMMDSQKQPLWFRLSYALPQVLTPLPFIAYVALARTHAWPLAILFAGLIIGCLFAKLSQAAFWISFGLAFAATATLAILFSGWFSLAFFAGLAFVAPWPSPWRTKWEARGYTMNLAVMAWTIGPPPSVVLDITVKHFISSDYYFMSWSKSYVETTLTAGIAGAVSGALQKEQPYGLVHDFLAARNELRS